MKLLLPYLLVFFSNFFFGTICFAQQKLNKDPKGFWGLYANGGLQNFWNIYKVDASMYHMPNTLTYSGGVQYEYRIGALAYLVFQGGINQNTHAIRAEKFNNVWSNYKLKNIGLQLGAAYRLEWGKHNPFYLQTGVALLLNTWSKISVGGSNHGNDNNVRDYLGSVATSKPRMLHTSLQVMGGYYVDKYKRHDISAWIRIPFYTYYPEAKPPMMQQKFTFADGSTENYRLDINGFPIAYGLQYSFWF